MALLNFDAYQAQTQRTAVYKETCKTPESQKAYTALGLSGEAGEVAGSVKKHLRGDFSSSELRERLRGEIGDVLWYCAQLAYVCGMSLGDIAQANLDKLAKRKDEGTLRGDGDNR